MLLVWGQQRFGIALGDASLLTGGSVTQADRCSRAVLGGYLVPTYEFYLRRYLFPNRLRMITGTDPGTSTHPELPGSVPDFFAGSTYNFEGIE